MLENKHINKNQIKKIIIFYFFCEIDDTFLINIESFVACVIDTKTIIENALYFDFLITVFLIQKKIKNDFFRKQCVNRIKTV